MVPDDSQGFHTDPTVSSEVVEVGLYPGCVVARAVLFFYSQGRSKMMFSVEALSHTKA
jgi:hypothetical protein